MSNDAAPRFRAWPVVVASAVIALVAAASIWWLALPRFEICAAIYPAPAGCGDGRVLPAIVVSVVLAVLLIATIALAVTVGRRRRWPALLGLALIVVAAVLGYWQVLYGPGLVPTF